MQRRKFLSLSALALTASALNLRAEDYRKSKPDVWTSHKVDDAIKKLYGTDKLVEKGVKLKIPKVASNGGAIPVNIKSDIDAKSVALFQDTNPESTVAVFTIHKDSIIDLDVNIKMKASGKITAVVEGKDGKLYAKTKGLEVALGGCEG
ncbi:MAG: thiosulfate oxidation carrier protein SoxY [Proteobacteria bacterium]|nr:MAG: thiosulfate oxidation carrier protein SoxY [Pseudomonadota bacterium]